LSFLSTQTISLRTPGAIAMLLVILGIVGITGVIRCAHADTNDTFPSAQSGVRYTQADPDSQEAEETFWDAVKDSGAPDLIEASLQSCLKGTSFHSIFWRCRSDDHRAQIE